MIPYDSNEPSGDWIEIDTLIRQAEPNDARALIGLTKLVGKETDYLTFGPEGVGLTVAQEMDLIDAFATSQENIMLVVEVDGQIIGMGNIATFGSMKQSHGSVHFKSFKAESYTTLTYMFCTSCNVF